MKHTAIITIALIFALTAQASVEINKLLQERIEVNKKYAVEFSEDAEDSVFAKILVPMEKENGENWVEYLEYIKSKNDVKLSYLTCLVEIKGELIGAYYDKEYAENILEKLAANSKIAEFKKQLKTLEAAYAEATKTEEKKATIEPGKK